MVPSDWLEGRLVMELGVASIFLGANIRIPNIFDQTLLYPDEKLYALLFRIVQLGHSQPLRYRLINITCPCYFTEFTFPTRSLSQFVCR